MSAPASDGRAAVSMTEQQAQLLERTALDLDCGGLSRALIHTLRAYGRAALGSPSIATSGGGERGSGAVVRGARGRVACELTLQPGTGKALELRRGDVLGIEQIAGGQCTDLNCYSVADDREHLHAAGTRTRHGLHPRAGDLLWSRPPAERPMMAIVSDGGGAIDTLFPRCTPGTYEDGGRAPLASELPGDSGRGAAGVRAWP